MKGIMVGWILGGLVAMAIGKVLLDVNNSLGKKRNIDTESQEMRIQCPFCNDDISVSTSLERRYFKCRRCYRKFIVDRNIVIKNMEVVQCVSCGHNVEVETNNNSKVQCGHCGTNFEYNKYITVSCASCGKSMKVPATRYAEVKCDNCGAIFNSDKGTLYRKTNSDSKSLIQKLGNGEKANALPNNSNKVGSAMANEKTKPNADNKNGKYENTKSSSQNQGSNNQKGIRINIDKPFLQMIEGRLVSPKYAVVSQNKVYYMSDESVLYINTATGYYEFISNDKVKIHIEETYTSNDLNFGLLNTAGVLAQYKSNSLPYNFDDVCTTMSNQANPHARTLGTTINETWHAECYR